MAFWLADATAEMEAVLEWVASQLADGWAPLRDGDVLPPAGPITARTRMEAFLAWAPVYWPDEAAGFEDEDGARVRITWLIPLHAAEAVLASSDPVALTRMFVAVDPHLLSLERPALAVPAP
jgi:hypothetical protein